MKTPQLIKSTLLLAGAAAILTVAPLTAQNVTWDAGGGGNTTWGNGTNWDTNVVPGTGADVFFGSAGSAANLSGAQTANSLTITRAMTISDSSASATGLTLTSGALAWTLTSTISSNVTLGANATWTPTGTNSLTVSGSIGEAAAGRSLTINGTGITTNLILSGSNSYGGGTVLNGLGGSSNIIFRNASALGTGNLTIQGAISGNNNILFGSGVAGSSVVFANSINLGNSTAGGGVTNIGVDTSNTPAKVTLGGITGIPGTQTFAINPGNSTIEFTGAIAPSPFNGNGLRIAPGAGNTGTVVLGNGSASAVSLQIFGNRTAVNLLQSTTGSVAGQIAINSLGTGIDTIGGVHASGTASFSNTISLTNASNTVGANLVSRNAGAITSFALITDVASTKDLNINGNFTVNSVAADAYNGLNTPVGTVVLTTANTYDGTTTVFGGVLNIRNATSLGTTGNGTVINSGAALEIQGGITVGAEALTLNGSGVSSGGALRNISGNNSYGGAVTLASASRINSDANTLTLTGGVTGTGLGLTIGGAGNTTISTNGVNTSTGGSLTKDGAGTLTMNATSNYTGVTTISSGTLLLSSTGSITNSSAIDFTSSGNGTLNVSAVSGFQIAANQTLQGTGLVVGNVTVSSTGILAPGNSAGTITFNNNLTLASGSVSNFEINGLTTGLYDLAQGGAGSQTVNFGGTLNLTFQSGFNTLGTVKIFDFETYLGSYASGVTTTGLASGYTATFNALDGVVTVVPEPSTWALLALSLTALVTLRRRRQKV